jgi:hypothetical protein
MNQCADQSRVIGSIVTYTGNTASVDLLVTTAKITPPDAPPTGVSNVNVNTSTITFDIDDSICGKTITLQLLGDGCTYDIPFNKPCSNCKCSCLPPFPIILLLLLLLLLSRKKKLF